MFTSLIAILEWQKSPILTTQIGGGPKLVFLARKSASFAIPLIGIVSPGLTHCNKKLSLVDKTMGECKCNNLYCQIHRDSSKHACTFDWHNTKKAELAVQLHSNKCVGSKITAI